MSMTNSAERLARALELGQQAAARVTAGKPVQIRFDQKEGAFVDTETGIIHLPPLGNIDDETVDIIRGLADHESGHVSETDLDVYRKINKKDEEGKPTYGGITHTFANAIEDNRCDKLQSKKALGVARNLDWLRRHFLYKKDLLANVNDNFGEDERVKALALISMEANFTGTEHEKYVREEAERYCSLYPSMRKVVEDELAEIPNLDSTEEVVNLSNRIVTKLKDYIDEEAEQKLRRGKGKGEAGEGGGTEGHGEGEGDWEESKIDEKFEKGMAGIGNGSTIYAGATYEELEGNVEKFCKQSRNDRYEEPVIPYLDGDVEIDFYTEKDYHKYMDRYHGDTMQFGFERWNENIKAQKAGINVMRRRLLIDLLGRVKKFINRQEEGSLNDREIWRAGLGDKNLFRKRQRTVAINAAVTLLVDCSGSMSGDKIEIASNTAMVMAETLDLVGVPFEVLGFTQQYHGMSSREVDRLRDLGYTRHYPLWNMIFKRFDRPLDKKTKSMIGAIPAISLCNNIDGESIRWAASRLAQRKEDKRILIVLSDGWPAGWSEYNSSADLKNVCKMIEASGAINLFGIGICDDAPAEYYKDYAIIDDVDQLAKTAYGKISTFLKGCRIVKVR